jgi:hypothetical protein
LHNYFKIDKLDHGQVLHQVAELTANFLAKDSYCILLAKFSCGAGVCDDKD